METRQLMQVFQIDQQCDKCKVGFMRPVHSTNLMWESSFDHICNNEECKTHAYYPVQYPYTVYEPGEIIKNNNKSCQQEIIPSTLA